MNLLRRLLAIAAHNWPQKLGALVLAVVMWLFITTSSISTTQRSVLVPLVVEGIQASQVATGVPTSVEVSVTGPSARINRLRPQNITATLDLGGLSGDFQEPVSVQPPQGVTLVSVSPSDVIGFIETVTTRTLSVTPGLTGTQPDDVFLTVTADPDTVTMTGRSQLLQRVARVIVLVPAKQGESQARPVPVDANGVPVADLSTAPDLVTVTVSAASALATKTVPLELEPPSDPAFADAKLDQSSVELVGPVQALAPLTSVQATVDPLTGAREPGRYTVPVRLELPSDVSALGTPTAEVRIGRTSD